MAERTPALIIGLVRKLTAAPEGVRVYELMGGTVKNSIDLSHGAFHDSVRSRMKRDSHWLWSVVACIALCLATASAAAKTISIIITTSAEFRGGMLTVNLTIRNLGDETANSVKPTLHFRDREARGTGVPSLAPNASLQEMLTIPAPELTPGRWPYRVSVDYTDTNQYPFQALQVLALAIGDPPPAKVAVSQIGNIRVADSGSLSVTFKNLAGASHTAVVRVVVPDSLEITQQQLPALSLSGWEEKTISTQVVNRTALAGSRLPAFVIVEYDDGPTHQAVVSHGLIEIVSKGSFFAGLGVPLWAVALILLLGWGGFILAWRLRRRRRHGA